jgi:MauM/NapG family ferredoxin protein
MPAESISSAVMSRAEFLGQTGKMAIVIASSPLSAWAAAGVIEKNAILRPPGARKGEAFLELCIRCGNCMKVCPTHVLQPSRLEKGFPGLWSPIFDGEHSYCEYKCTLCGRVCPTGAIRELDASAKEKEKIAIAVIDRKLCLPWAKGEPCIVCEEHCPVSTKAIALEEQLSPAGKKLKLPRVISETCVGCAICRDKCPVEPKKAITITALKD